MASAASRSRISIWLHSHASMRTSCPELQWRPWRPLRRPCALATSAASLARNIAAFALYDMAELQRARDQLLEAGKLIERIGARRFVPENLTYLAKIMRAEGQGFEARRLLD